MVPVFERVYLVSHAYRAEPSVTTRHLSEATQLDCELGFVNFEELLDAVEMVGQTILRNVTEKHPEILEEFGVEPPEVNEKFHDLHYEKHNRLFSNERVEIIGKNKIWNRRMRKKFAHGLLKRINPTSLRLPIFQRQNAHFILSPIQKTLNIH